MGDQHPKVDRTIAHGLEDELKVTVGERLAAERAREGAPAAARVPTPEQPGRGADRPGEAEGAPVTEEGRTGE
jgi:hypothetical protein